MSLYVFFILYLNYFVIIDVLIIDTVIWYLIDFVMISITNVLKIK